MTDAIERLRAAIENEGPEPSYQRRMMARHRREWPTLWAAIDEVLAPPDPPHTDAVQAVVDAAVEWAADDGYGIEVDGVHQSTEDLCDRLAAAVRALAGATAPDPDPHTTTEPDTDAPAPYYEDGWKWAPGMPRPMTDADRASLVREQTEGDGHD